MRFLHSLAGRFRSISRVFRRYYRPIYGSLVIGTVLTLLVLLVLQGLPFFAQAEQAAYDFQFQVRGGRPAPANIVFVGLDQTSITDLNDSSYPIPRRWMASAVRFLHRAGARVIALDFLYEKPRADDVALGAAIKRAGNVVQGDELAALLSSSYVEASVQLQPPVDPVARAALRLGLVNVPQDSDTKIRSVDLMQVCPGGSIFGSRICPSFTTQIASVALHRSVADVIRGLPNHMYINYVGPQPPGDSSLQSFQTYQFEGVARGEDDPSVFRNKIVIVGCAAITCNDMKDTPYGQMYGGVVQANALVTTLNRNPIVPVGNTANSLLLLIVGLITTIVASRFGIWRSTSGTLAIAVGYAALGYILIQHYNSWINLVTPETTIVLVFAGVMSLRFGTEERQRRKLSKKFGLYVKPEIVDILMNAHEEEAALKPTRRPISILFVDVRGFTAMSEQMEPEDVVDALDVYLEELTASVQQFDGTVNKYVGDELVAVWNAPMSQENHAMLSVMCALDMISRMESINRQLRALTRPAIAYGIGINSGDAVVGEMGSSFRVQYDVIGDTVNTGARLCSAAGRGEIIVGENTWQLLGDRLVVEETEPLKLKGKSRPFRTFRLIDVRQTPEAMPEVVPAPA